MEEDLLTRTTQHGVTIAVFPPEGWEPAEGLLGTAVSLFAPVANDGEFRANLNVLVQDEPTQVSADGLTDAHGKAATLGLEEPRTLDVELTAIDDREASRVLVAYVLDGDDLTLEQWIVPVDDATVVVSFTCLTNDFGRYRPAVADVISTLAIDA